MARIVHVLTVEPDQVARAAVVADLAAGDEVDCVCLEEAAVWAVAALHTGVSPVAAGARAARLFTGADDCRRRGLSAPAAATLEYTQIIDAMAAADRVVSW